MPPPKPPAPAIQTALRTLGRNIRAARLRRNLSHQLVSERALISRPMLIRIEKGDAGVGMGGYASVLQVLGLLDSLSAIAGIEDDFLGQTLVDQSLRRNVRKKAIDAHETKILELVGMCPGITLSDIRSALSQQGLHFGQSSISIFLTSRGLGKGKARSNKAMQESDRTLQDE